MPTISVLVYIVVYQNNVYEFLNNVYEIQLFSTKLQTRVRVENGMVELNF